MGTNKYYTPEIEEFHIGFEYEFYGMSTGGLSILNAKKNKLEKIKDPDIKIWTKEKLYKDDSGIFNRTLKSIRGLLISDQIRVKYLDREDIESLGFKYNGSKMIKNYRDEFNLEIGAIRYNLTYIYGKKLLKINSENLVMFEEHLNYLFQGNIKNKSELKRILKQLNI